jgi:hypothetical protein
MNLVLGIVSLATGIVLSGIGICQATDPENHSGYHALLVPGGGLITAAAAAYLVYLGLHQLVGG